MRKLYIFLVIGSLRLRIAPQEHARGKRAKRSSKKEHFVFKEAPNFLIRSPARCNKVVVPLRLAKEKNEVWELVGHLLERSDLSEDGDARSHRLI